MTLVKLKRYMIVVVALFPLHSRADCGSDAIYDLVAWNEQAREILMRSLQVVSENRDERINRAKVNQAVIVAAQIDFPFKTREVLEIKFSENLVGEALIQKTEEFAAAQRAKGFSKINVVKVERMGSVTNPPGQNCKYESTCGEVEFKDPLNNGGKFIVRKSPLTGGRDAEHGLFYENAGGERSVLHKSLVSKSIVNRSGLAYPKELFFWNTYVTAASGWCLRPYPWTHKISPRAGGTGIAY